MKALETIKFIDLFSHPVSSVVNLQGKTKYRTFYGVTLTLFAFILIIIFSSKKFIEMNTRERP